MSRRRKTHEEFLLDLKQKHGDKLRCITKYVKAIIKVTVICNDCGDEWTAIPNAILSTGCKKCKSTYKYCNVRKTHKKFLSQVKEVHGESLDIISDYKGSAEPVNVRCRAGHTYAAVANTILQGAGCRKCYFERAKLTTTDYLIKLKSKNPSVYNNPIYDFSALEYKGAKLPLEGLVCKLHGSICPLAYSLLSGQGPCKHCTKRQKKKE